MKHILSVDQFTKDFLELMARRATAYRLKQTTRPAAGKLLTNLFYEPSSRTFASFFSAMVRLGGQVIPIQEAGTYSSAVKGESLEDTIRTMQCYCDVIVLRHGDNGAAVRASNYATVPIINAGDGTGEHPTQALLDFYTILMERQHGVVRRIDDCFNGLTITLMGDLKHGRTVKSLSKLLRLYDVKINWVSPPELRIPAEFIHQGDQEVDDLNAVIAGTDVLYVTRVQRERMVKAGIFNRWQRKPSLYGVTCDHLTKAKSNMILMHPMPRLTELPTQLDDDPRSAYFRQMSYGLHIRMAVLEHVLA